MPITIVELAQMAGVSDTTVSLVLNGKGGRRVSATRRKQIKKLAEKHGYKPNLMARGLVKGRHYRIGICWGGSFSDENVLGEVSRYQRLALFSRGFHNAGYSIELLETNPAESPEEISRKLTERPVDGHVLIGWSEALALPVVFHLKAQQKPAVVSESWLDDSALTWTATDTGAAIVDAVRRLAAEGHKRIGFIMLARAANRKRLRTSYLKTMAEITGQNAQEWIFEAPEWHLPTIRKMSEQAVEILGKSSALLLYDTYYGGAVLDGLRDAGVQIGNKFRVIGFGSTLLADRVNPRLSHYGMCVPEQVAFGTDALMEQINNWQEYEPRHKCFVPEYTPRET